MKKVFMNVMALLLIFSSKAQENNPYSKRGIDYFASLNIISADYQAGKVKEINEASLKTYSKLVPLQNQVSSELAANILKTTKAPGYSLTGLISNSSFSAFTKKMVPQLLNVKALPRQEFQLFLCDKVNEVNKQALNPNEKEMLLSLIAISYHAPASVTSRRSECNIQTPTYSGPASNDVCVTAGAIAGFFIGLPLCGILCGLGGALIGGIAVALS
ncbi:MAG: hypothetical protein NTZ41_04940 [Sphingobacteriales bacterium]|nr:hypothetical protein [Sphingobacteriales bacterium]